jgi:glycine hydroxymethyltransferase
MDKILDLIAAEKKRQQETLMMIPSENYTYPEVREAVGSILMHKYAEGYPGRRYYQGNSVIDGVEDLCRVRALEAFGLDREKFHANVQPHSGCEANLAVYNTLLNPGDRIMSMYLPDGGHLSHGWQMPSSAPSELRKGEGVRKVTFVSKVFNVEFYHVDPETRVFDYDQIEKQALEFNPKLIISGGTAYPREIDYKRMGEIAKKVGAYYLADVAHEAGLIAAGVCKAPFEFADMVTMTTHKTLRGPRGAMIICKKDLGQQLDLALMPGLQGGPHLHTIAGIAVALGKTKTSEFKSYARQTVVNAQKLAEVLTAGGLDVVAGGTDKHLVLIDLRNKKTNGWFVAWAMEFANIIMNRNTVPNDSGSPFYPSGLRMGTPALTVRGMKEAEMELIGGWILKIIDIVGMREIPENADNRKKYLADFLEEMRANKEIEGIRQRVLELTAKFPVPGME